MADLRRLAQRAVAKLYHDSFIHGRLGRLNSDGSYTIRVPDRPTHAYVQMASEGGQTIAVARNPGNVALRANLPVRLRSENGELVIDGLDYAKLAMVESADPSGPPASGVQVHHHRIGSGLEYEYDPRLFEAGRVYHASGMAVYINPFRYQKPDGTFEYWEGGSLDITSHQPGTAGEHAWVLVGIDPSDNTATAAAGTAKADTSELTIAELDDITFAGKIPCGAVRVREDDGDLSDLSKYVDAHGWHNQALNQLRNAGTLGVYVDASGQVGIGTDTPSAPMHVAGNIRLSASGNQSIEFDDGNPVFQWHEGNENFQILDGGSAADMKVGSLVVSASFGDTAPTNGVFVSGDAYFGGTPFTAMPFYVQSGTGTDFTISGTNVTRVARYQRDTGATIDIASDGTGIWFHNGLNNSGYHAWSTRTSTSNVTRMTLSNDGYLHPNGLGESWNALSFASGWGNVGSGYNGQYRKFGDHVYLRGQVERTSGSSTTIATLPSGYRPSSTVQIPVVFDKAGTLDMLMVQIATNGVVSYGIGAYSTGDRIWLDSLYFSI